MDDKYLIASFVLLVAFLLFILRNVRRSQLPPRYAGMWITYAAFLMAVVVVPDFFQFVSRTAFGFNSATNFVYILVIGILSLFIFLLTLHVVRISDRLQILISRVAIAEARVHLEDGKADNLGR